MNHRQVRDLLPEFALGALELQEQEELLQHLRSCSSCYLLAQEHMEVAEILASEIAEVEPPAELKGMIEDSVADQPKPLETRIRGTGPSFLDRLGLTGRLPALAASAASVAALGLIAAVLVYVVISQGDLSGLRDENRVLTSTLDEQVTTVAESQAALADLSQDNQALAAALDRQSVALSTSQGNLDSLSEVSIGLSAKLDAQAAVLDLAQDSLANLRVTNESLAPVLGSQSDALAAARETLSDLQRENQTLAATLDEQRTLLDNTQQSLENLRDDNFNLTARIDDQDEVLAASQSDIVDLNAQNLALAATLTNQQVFSYLQSLPVTHKYVLKATANAPGTFGLLVTNVANTWGIAAVLGVDPLEPGTVYDLWLEKDGVATHGWFIKKIDPDTQFGQVYAETFPTPVDQFDRIFITLEPEGGSPAPTGPELLAATIN